MDKHILALDDDLRTLGAEIKADKERLGVKEDETVLEPSKSARLRGFQRMAGGALAPTAAAAGQAAAEAAGERKRRGKKRKDEVEDEEGRFWFCAGMLW